MKLSSLFFERVWDIGYRCIETNEQLPDKSEYTIIKAKLNEWYADPFCVNHNGKQYIFCEKMDLWKNKGEIVVFEINDEKCIDKPKTVIEENFHLSYPNVFRVNGIWYMIPETSRIKQLRLYRCKRFPDKWELDKILLSDIKLVDTTLFCENDKMFLVSMKKGENKNPSLIFEFNPISKTVHLLDEKYGCIIGQGAGNPICINGVVYRCSQYYGNVYGEKIFVNQILTPFCDCYSEKSVKEITVFNALDKRRKKYDAIHTLNRDGQIEVIDLGYSKFTCLKPFHKIVNLWTRKMRIK